jgi:hypothetical protein
LSSWLLVQVADVVFDAFDLPQWIFRAFITVLASGFPVALVMAWFFELTTSGLVRNEDLPANYSQNDDFKKYLNPIIITMLSTAVVLIALDKFVWTPSAPKVDPAVADNRTPHGNSLAVLPFTVATALMPDCRASPSLSMGLFD